jgi:hypothetical protein
MLLPGRAERSIDPCQVNIRKIVSSAACASGDAISTGLAIGHGVLQHTRGDAEADNEHFDKKRRIRESPLLRDAIGAEKKRGAACPDKRRPQCSKAAALSLPNRCR